VAAADIKETIQQPKRMKYKKPIETFAYKVLKNYTMVMPTITIRELDIGNEEFEEFSKHFSSFIGIKLEIKGDIIFVKELEEQLFYSNENYTNYR
jgi:CheY-specific phosphatase CheX